MRLAPPWKHLIYCKYSFKNLTQFLQGNNMLDATASNSHWFLSRDICVSSTQLFQPISNKIEPITTMENHLENSGLQEVFLSTTN
jgi:hypothetical protein